MNKALIITSHVEHLPLIDFDFSQFHAIICADGGHLVSKRLNIKPNYIIGDFDSSPSVCGKNVITLPAEKDMTDTEAAVDFALDKGFSDITILGGLGGRLDHTFGNIGLLSKYCGYKCNLTIVDGQNCAFMKLPSSFSVSKGNYKYLGVISYGGNAENVTLKGVKYPLTNHLLDCSTSLGVSNEIVESTAQISFSKGKLLIILSKDVDNFQR